MGLPRMLMKNTKLLIFFLIVILVPKQNYAMWQAMKNGLQAVQVGAQRWSDVLEQQVDDLEKFLGFDDEEIVSEQEVRPANFKPSNLALAAMTSYLDFVSEPETVRNRYRRPGISKCASLRSLESVHEALLLNKKPVPRSRAGSGLIDSQGSESSEDQEILDQISSFQLRKVTSKDGEDIIDRAPSPKKLEFSDWVMIPASSKQ